MAQMLQMLPAILADQNENTAQINIDGQFDNSGQATINKTFPILLNDRISQSSWTRFCEEVDRELEPLSGIRSTLKIVNIARGFVGLCIMVAFAFLLIPSGLNDNEVMGLGMYKIILLIGIPVVLTVALACYTSKITSRFQDIVTEVKEICTRKSNDDPEITFSVEQVPHVFTAGVVRLQTRGIYQLCISIKVAGARGNETGMGGMGGMGGVGGVVRGNTAERLQELDGIKSLLTAQEYEQKRQNILNSV